MLNVKGSFHQGHPKFYGAGKQCTAISMCAMMHAMTKRPCSWTGEDMDMILTKGDNLYQTITADKYLLISDLPNHFENYSFSIKKSFSGTVGRVKSEEPFMTLADAFENTEQFCFITIDCYTMCVMNFDNTYYMFDSHSRNDCGMSSPDGTATMTSHNTLDALCSFIKHLCATLFTEIKDKLFEVTHIAIKSAPEVLYDSEESEFEGFSEVSDGEYACTLYIANELTKAALGAVDSDTGSESSENTSQEEGFETENENDTIDSKDSKNWETNNKSDLMEEGNQRVSEDYDMTQNSKFKNAEIKNIDNNSLRNVLEKDKNDGQTFTITECQYDFEDERVEDYTCEESNRTR
jgi:hypothetical protein